MRRRLTCSVLIVLAVVAAGCSPGDETTQPETTETQIQSILDVGEEDIQGTFSMIVMAHTTSFGGTDVEEEQEPNPWDGSTGEGPYRYAAIPCHEDAPLNNISGDLPSFNTLIPGSRVPASTRAHPMEFDVAEGDDGEMQLEGTLDLTVCQLRPGVTPDPDPVPDAEKDSIRFEWNARAAEASEESVVWRGTFDIAGGTGPYEQLEGEGTVTGYFFCFAPEGCEELGEYRDVQFTLSGSYQVPADALDEAEEPVPQTEDAGGAATENVTEAPTEAETGPATEAATESATEATEPAE